MVKQTAIISIPSVQSSDSQPLCCEKFYNAQHLVIYLARGTDLFSQIVREKNDAANTTIALVKLRGF